MSSSGGLKVWVRSGSAVSLAPWDLAQVSIPATLLLASGGTDPLLCATAPLLADGSLPIPGEPSPPPPQALASNPPASAAAAAEVRRARLFVFAMVVAPGVMTLRISDSPR
jgi:hypothetical protein